MSSTSLALPQLLIIEFGGQLTLKIESGNRENGYRSAILDRAKAVQWIKQFPVKGVILSGGLASVYDEDAPRIPQEILNLNVPILGICYGMQALAHHFGGIVEKRTPQYARAVIRTRRSELFAGMPEAQRVWSNHGDSVGKPPEGFSVTATYADTDGIAAIADERRRIWGVQFHPEADQTEYGKAMLARFAELCGCERDWRPAMMVDVIRENTLAQIGSRDEVVMGASGGVDSSTVGAILAPAIGSRLHPISIDGGQFRENELPEVRQNIQASGMTNHIVIEAMDQFFSVLSGVADAETKREHFAQNYGKVFVDTALRLGPNVKWFAQGTLAPDRIESGKTGGDRIKGHHNEIADCGFLQRIDPVKDLFKYEIRALARELGLPASISERQPSPGPGLFIRHIGPITRDGIAIVRWADARTKEVLVDCGIYESLSQLIVAYFSQPLVGIKGDKRSYQGFAGIRAVKTADFMTAEGYAWPPELQKEICRILGKHPRIVHAAFFPMDKPPGTTEFE